MHGARPTVRRSAVLALAIVVLASCSGGSGDDATTSTAPTTTAPTDPQAGPDASSLNVAVVSQGDPAADAWTYGHYQGSQAIADELGEDGVILAYSNGVQPGDVARKEIERVIEGGSRLVFVTTPTLAADAEAVAADHPEVTFAIVGGSELTDNVGTFRTADQEAVFLSGMAAAGTSERGRIGYVGPIATPAAILQLDAFTLGARRVDPDVEVHVRWLGSFWEPVAEAQLVGSLVADGADVIATGSQTLIAGQESARLGVPWLGYGSPWSDDFPAGWLTAAYPDWGPYYRAQALAVRDGTWAPEEHVGTLATDESVLAPPSDLVPAPIVDQIEQAEAALRTGELRVFAGPIRDLEGAVRIPEGATGDEGEEPTIDWYVEGVVIDDQQTG